MGREYCGAAEWTANRLPAICPPDSLKAESLIIGYGSTRSMAWVRTLEIRSPENFLHRLDGMAEIDGLHQRGEHATGSKPEQTIILSQNSSQACADDPLDTRTADFNNHLAAVEQRRRVNLRDGRRSSAALSNRMKKLSMGPPNASSINGRTASKESGGTRS